VLKEPKPIVQVAVLADSSIDIAVKPWASVADSVSVGGEIYKAVVESFRARGIVIPFPQREVRMLSKAA
jgi:small conductance mechanosensitive channel